METPNSDTLPPPEESSVQPTEDTQSQLTAKQLERKAHFKAGRISMFFSAVSLFVSLFFNGIILSGNVEEYPIKNDLDRADYRDLNPQVLREVWEYRRDLQFLTLLIDFLLFLGLFYMWSGISAYKKMFLWASPSLRLSMSNCIALACIFPALEALQNLGTLMAGIWVSGHSAFPGDEFSSLEISFLIVSARSGFIFTLSFLLLAASLIFSFILNLKEQVLPTWVNWWSLITALFAVIIFGIISAFAGADVTDVSEARQRTSEALFAITIIFLIFLLTWICTIGVYLGRYVPPTDEEIEKKKEEDQFN